MLDLSNMYAYDYIEYFYRENVIQKQTLSLVSNIRRDDKDYFHIHECGNNEIIPPRDRQTDIFIGRDVLCKHRHR